MRTFRFTCYCPADSPFVPYLNDHRTCLYRARHSGLVETSEDSADLSQLLARACAETNVAESEAGRWARRTGDVIHLEGHGVWLYGYVGWAGLSGPAAERFPLVQTTGTEEPGRVSLESRTTRNDRRTECASRS